MHMTQCTRSAHATCANQVLEVCSLQLSVGAMRVPVSAAGILSSPLRGSFNALPRGTRQRRVARAQLCLSRITQRITEQISVMKAALESSQKNRFDDRFWIRRPCSVLPARDAHFKPEQLPT